MNGPSLNNVTKRVQEAQERHSAAQLLVLTSGGNDSTVLLHTLKDFPDVIAIHLDTGIGLPETQAHTRAICEAWGVPLEIYRALDYIEADGTPAPQDYEQLVQEHGFPGPHMHGKMYNRLKERPLRMAMRVHQRHRGDRVLLITGVRSAESRRRMGYVEPEQRDGGWVWVAPLHDWSNGQMAAYRSTHALPVNPASQLLGISGECLCGAFAAKGELARICQHFPATGRRLLDLERRVIEAGFPWGWEEKPPRWWSEHTRGQGMMAGAMDMLCATCSTRQADRAAIFAHESQQVSQ